jgi:hypothetical protein
MTQIFLQEEQTAGIRVPGDAIGPEKKSDAELKRSG